MPTISLINWGGVSGGRPVFFLGTEVGTEELQILLCPLNKIYVNGAESIPFIKRRRNKL